jgi:hypothetical protein
MFLNILLSTLSTLIIYSLFNSALILLNIIKSTPYSQYCNIAIALGWLILLYQKTDYNVYLINSNFYPNRIIENLSLLNEGNIVIVDWFLKILFIYLIFSIFENSQK